MLTLWVRSALHFNEVVASARRLGDFEAGQACPPGRLYQRAHAGRAAEAAAARQDERQWVEARRQLPQAERAGQIGGHLVSHVTQTHTRFRLDRSNHRYTPVSTGYRARVQYITVRLVASVLYGILRYSRTIRYPVYPGTVRYIRVPVYILRSSLAIAPKKNSTFGRGVGRQRSNRI